MSIVTSDSNVVREQMLKLAANNSNSRQSIVMTDMLHGMSRMSWLMALRPLFDSLKAFHCNSKKRHIEKDNFLDALEKVKSTLKLKELSSLNGSEETHISFQSVWHQFNDHLPEYFTWDNLFDVLLFTTVASQFVYEVHGANGDENVPQQDFNNGYPGCDLDESADIVMHHQGMGFGQGRTGEKSLARGGTQNFDEIVMPLTSTVTILSDPV